MKQERQDRSQPRRYAVDLPAHMAVCDTNYLKLEKLFPNLVDQAQTRYGVAAGDGSVAVVLKVKERSPYTTLLVLSQEPETRFGPVPSITVRMYHDARSAEVVEYQHQGRFAAVYDYPNRQMRQRDEKIQVNQLLGEVLTHCLTHGTPLSQSALKTPS